MSKFINKLKEIAMHSNLKLNCDTYFDDDPLPRFDFDTFDLLKENTEQDERFNQYARYITEKIKEILWNSLSSDEKAAIKTEKVKELKKQQTDSFSFILPTKIINILPNKNGLAFPAFNLVFDTFYAGKPVATTEKTVYGINIVLNLLNLKDQVNLGRLKQFFIHLHTLDHEITHYLDYSLDRIHPTKKSFEDYDNDSCYKANAPAEWHAYGQQLISMLKDKYEKDKFEHKDINNLIKIRNINTFFNTLRQILSAKLLFIDKLTFKTKQDLMGRVINYILYRKRKTEAFYERYYREETNKEFTTTDLNTYMIMLYENMELNKKIILIEDKE